MPLYDGCVGLDATFSLRNSLWFFRDDEEYARVVQALKESGECCVYRLTVCEVLPPHVHRYLLRRFIEVGCDVTDTNHMIALEKHVGRDAVHDQHSQQSNAQREPVSPERKQPLRPRQ